jgi:hypothetical protein
MYCAYSDFSHPSAGILATFPSGPTKSRTRSSLKSIVTILSSGTKCTDKDGYSFSNILFASSPFIPFKRGKVDGGVCEAVADMVPWSISTSTVDLDTATVVDSDADAKIRAKANNLRKLVCDSFIDPKKLHRVLLRANLVVFDGSWDVVDMDRLRDRR